MLKKFLCSLAVLGTTAAPVVPAQEGHPMDGTWRGTLESDSGETRPVLLIMDYNGEEIEGMINPGPDSMDIQSAELDAPNWELHATAQSPEAGTVEFTATLQDIGSRSRYLEGTWRQEGEEYDFRVTRQ